MITGQLQTVRGIGRLSRTNFTLTEVDAKYRTAEEEVLSGLRGTPKTIPCKYLYDTEGSRLFDRICKLPEYYLTRAETCILRRHSRTMLGQVGQDLCIVELGAGACRKSRLLLDTGAASSFFPVDISTEHLRDEAMKIAYSYP
ncbi:MAG: L-histidine N(alpha)-methyltransferase, partial [Nitrospirota bacterium]